MVTKSVTRSVYTGEAVQSIGQIKLRAVEKPAND